MFAVFWEVFLHQMFDLNGFDLNGGFSPIGYGFKSIPVIGI